MDRPAPNLNPPLALVESLGEVSGMAGSVSKGMELGGMMAEQFGLGDSAGRTLGATGLTRDNVWSGGREAGGTGGGGLFPSSSSSEENPPNISDRKLYCTVYCLCVEYQLPLNQGKVSCLIAAFEVPVSFDDADTIPFVCRFFNRVT